MKITEISKRDYFAGQAMQVVSSEMQETVPASLWDWIKMLLRDFLHMTFLHVNYSHVDGIKEQIVKRSFEMADLMVKHSEIPDVEPVTLN